MIRYGNGKAGKYGKQEARKQQDLLFKRVILAGVTCGVIGGLMMGMPMGSWFSRQYSVVAEIPGWAYILILLVAVGIVYVVAHKLTDKMLSNLDDLSRARVHYLRGGQTEALVAYTLQELNDQWHLFNGIAMKGGGDIDHVLVGPGGLYCISTKSQKGCFSLDQSKQLMVNGELCNHAKEAQALALKLRNWLEARLQPDNTVKSIPFVQPVLVAPFGYFSFHEKSLNVWIMDADRMVELMQKSSTSLQPEVVLGCVRILKDLSGMKEYQPDAAKP